MNIHRKVISMPSIFTKITCVKAKGISQQPKKNLKQTAETREKKELKEKVLFKLINKKSCRPKGKINDINLNQLEKQRLDRFMFLSSKLGNKITGLRKARANSISHQSLQEINKQITPQPHFIHFFKSRSKSRLQLFSNPSLIIKSKKLFPIITARP